MPRSNLGILLGVTLLCLTVFLSAAPPLEGKNAPQADPAGWIDLMPGKDLKGWKRIPLPPDEKLNPKNPWSLSGDGKLLLCDGVGVKEMFLNEREFGDGIFHVEWRFRKVEGKADYNGGVYVRTASNAKVWHQAQVAHLEKPPLLGDLFGESMTAGRLEKFQVTGKGHQLAKPPGEWNTYDITCKGKEVIVRVNNEVATTWKDCQVPKGHVGLQAEFYFLEFRSLKFKPIE